MIMKKLYVCPFDRNHTVAKQKLLGHIQKCKAPTRVQFSPCPYNVYHWVHHAQLQTHKKQCEYKSSNKVKNSFLDYEDDYKEQKIVMPNTSIISSIEKESFRNEESMQSIALNFELNIYNKNVPTMNKKINKKQLKELNQGRLWRQPNFSQWIDSKNSIQYKKSKNIIRNANEFMQENSF